MRTANGARSFFLLHPRWSGVDIAVCPRCASLDLRVPTIRDGLWPGGGETNFQVCADCAYRGAPLLFEDEGDYLSFRQNVPDPPADDHAAPEAPQRAMPFFVAAVALVMVAAALAGGAAAALDPQAGTWGRVAALLGVFVGLLFGAAFARIAYRAWRPGPA